MKRAHPKDIEMYKLVCSYHIAPNEQLQFVKEYIKRVPKARRGNFELLLSHGWDHRSFVGFIHTFTKIEQMEVLSKETGPHRYYVAFSGGYPGDISVHYTRIDDHFGQRRVWGYRASSFEDIYK
jgi:hypothetical protein